MSVALEMFLAAVVIGLLGGGLAGIVMKNGGHGLLQDLAIALAGSTLATLDPPGSSGIRRHGHSSNEYGRVHRGGKSHRRPTHALAHARVKNPLDSQLLRRGLFTY